MWCKKMIWLYYLVVSTQKKLAVAANALIDIYLAIVNLTCNY